MPAPSENGALPGASGREFAALMTARTTIAEALRAVSKRGLEVLAGHRRALLAGSQNVEHVHQARVALRRIRSAVRLLDPECREFRKRRLRDIRHLARTLGDARDWDVLVAKTLPAILASFEGKIEVKAGLLKRARRLREEAAAAAIDAMASRRFHGLLNTLTAWCASQPPPSPMAAEVAPGRIDAIADTIAACANTFQGLSTRERHRVRIEVKRLRYALDLLRPALPRGPVGDYIDSLAALQDTLGALNDATVARQKLSRAAVRRAERRLVNEWYRQVEPRLVARAALQLDGLARRKRPWRRTADRAG